MRILFSFVLVAVWAGCLCPAFGDEPEIQLRRPIALAVSGDGTWLYTANRDSGTISIIRTAEKSVASELTVGGRLSDLALVDDHTLLTLDEQNHQLVLLRGNKTDWKVAARQDVSTYPIRLELAARSGHCYITSLWPQTVSLVEFKADGLESHPRLTVAKTLQLPFEPREMVLTSDEKHLIVADAFGGNLAVLAAETLKLIKTKTLPGHNIRGLAESQNGKRLLVVQQELNPLARTTEDDVHWGNLLMNQLVSLSLSDLCDPQLDARIHRTLIPLGGPSQGAGDPGTIHVDSTGKMAVLLTGGNEVALAEERNSLSFQRIAVGQRPVALAALPDGRLFVANMFSDSISIVDLIARRQIAEVSLGKQPKLRPDQLGEKLFFDSRLSLDGWMSCHSCHTDGHTNGQLNDNLSDGYFGAPKRVLSLLGVAETGPWAWNGEMKSLQDQVASSIEKTMQGGKPTKEDVEALSAYLETLSAPPANPDPPNAEFASEVEMGRKLFRALDCRRCHAPPLYTTPEVYDVGLKDAAGHRQFNPPSLRGVGKRQNLFHDGTASSLEDVLVNHKHQLNRDLTKEELKHLLQFLRSL